MTKMMIARYPISVLGFWLVASGCAIAPEDDLRPLPASESSVLDSANGQSLFAMAEQALSLQVAGGQRNAAQSLAAVICMPGFTTLRSRGNNLFVSAEVDYGGGDKGMLRARAPAAQGTWEQFELCSDDGNATLALRSRGTGLYVSVEFDYGGADTAMLRARAAAIGPWERFTLQTLDAPFVSIRSAGRNQPYVSAEVDYSGADKGMLRARAAAVQGTWEQFQ